MRFFLRVKFGRSLRVQHYLHFPLQIFDFPRFKMVYGDFHNFQKSLTFSNECQDFFGDSVMRTNSALFQTHTISQLVSS